MMGEYQIYLNLEFVDTLPRSGNRRDLIFDFIRTLNRPDLVDPDFRISDPVTGRILEANIIGKDSLIWWIDGPGREVKVVRTSPAAVLD